MKLDEAMKRLEALGTEKSRAQNARNGAGENQFGVLRGDIRKLAKEIGTDRSLAAELWNTGNVDAQFLSILIVKPKDLTPEKLDEMTRDVTFVEVLDWFTSYIVKKHPGKEQLRQLWMSSSEPMAARAGWSLTADRIAKGQQDIDHSGLLDRIESEMSEADPESQWTMNVALAEIGINSPTDRERALAIGEKLGVYRDYPVSKGCTSPFAPAWINEMVSRQG